MVFCLYCPLFSPFSVFSDPADPPWGSRAEKRNGRIGVKNKSEGVLLTPERVL